MHVSALVRCQSSSIVLSFTWHAGQSKLGAASSMNGCARFLGLVGMHGEAGRRPSEPGQWPRWRQRPRSRWRWHPVAWPHLSWARRRRRLSPPLSRSLARWNTAGFHGPPSGASTASRHAPMGLAIDLCAGHWDGAAPPASAGSPDPLVGRSRRV